MVAECCVRYCYSVGSPTLLFPYCPFMSLLLLFSWLFPLVFFSRARSSLPASLLLLFSLLFSSPILTYPFLLLSCSSFPSCFLLLFSLIPSCFSLAPLFPLIFFYHFTYPFLLPSCSSFPYCFVLPCSLIPSCFYLAPLFIPLIFFSHDHSSLPAFLLLLSLSLLFSSPKLTHPFLLLSCSSLYPSCFLLPCSLISSCFSLAPSYPVRPSHLVTLLSFLSCSYPPDLPSDLPTLLFPPKLSLSFDLPALLISSCNSCSSCLLIFFTCSEFPAIFS